jgi:hypothetical protein
MLTTLSLSMILGLTAQDPMAVPPVPKELDQIKWLLGNWRGTGKMAEPTGQTADVSGGGICKMTMERWISWDGNYVMKGQGEMTGRLMVTYNNYTKQFDGNWYDNLTPYPLVLRGYTEGRYLVLNSQEIDMGGGNMMKFKISYENISKSKMGLTVKYKMGDQYMTAVSFTYNKK